MFTLLFVCFLPNYSLCTGNGNKTQTEVCCNAKKYSNGDSECNCSGKQNGGDMCSGFGIRCLLI